VRDQLIEERAEPLDHKGRGVEAALDRRKHKINGRVQVVGLDEPLVIS
jgi:hypothetical protein